MPGDGARRRGVADRKDRRCQLVSAAEEFASLRGGRSAVIHAQTRARGFYERIGYSVFGEPDEEEGVPHIWMRKMF